jgi:hypothetical protein
MCFFIAFVILQHLERTVFGDTSFDGGHVLWQQKIERQCSVEE